MSNNEDKIECDHFKSVVKISYEKQGSGIIFLPKIDSPNAYILTAKHNFEDINDNLILLNKLNYEKIQVGFKEYNEDVFINILIKDVIYLDVDLVVMVVESNHIDREVLKILPVLNILNNSFSNCIFKGYPAIKNSEIQCIRSNYHAKTNRNFFTITTEQDQSTYDSSELDNTVGFSGSGLLTAFNKKPILTGIIIKVSSSFNEIECIDLKKAYEDINLKLNDKGYFSIDILESENVDLSKSNQIETINNHQISLSTNININEQHKKIIEKLESYDIEEAKKLLEEIFQPSGETFRLKALIALTDKNLELAFSYIDKAKNKEVIPNDLEFVKGLVYYFSSIDKKGYEKITPYPLNSLYIKFDYKSQENIKKAQIIFSDLSNKNENIDYDVWYLASLHLIDLKETENKAKEFIESNPLHHGVITYITAFNFNIDLNLSIQKLEGREDKSINNIIDLINCYNHQKLFSKSISLLEKNKDKFEDIELLEKCYINTYMLDKKFDNALKVIKESIRKSIQKLEKIIIIEKYYETAQWDNLINLYEKDLTIENLYNICKIKAIQNDWEFISEKTNELLKNLKLFGILDLVITAKFNIKKYREVLDLLEEYKYLYVELNDKFKRMKANCSSKIGDPLSSIAMLESLGKKDIQDYKSLIYLNKKIGNDDEVSNLGIELLKKDNLSIENKIVLANTFQNDNSYIAKRFYECIDDNNVPDELKPTLVATSLQLNMFNQKIISDINDNPYFEKLNVNDFMEWMEKQNEINEKQNEDYKRRKFSFHFLSNNRFFVDNLIVDSTTPIFIRSGNKNKFKEIKKSIEHIYCDISSLILLEFLEILDLTLKKYILYIPNNTLLYLKKISYNENLKRLINCNIKERKIFLTEELEEDELKNCNNILEIDLRSLVKTKVKTNSILLIDDRFMNKYSQTDQAEIFGINDLLYTFLEKAAISKEIYYQKLLLLRERNLMFIPFFKNELLFYLLNASIKDKQLVETNELQIIRKHFAFTIQNIQYLSIKENDEKMSEMYFFSNINNIIEQIYYELWNLDQGNWDIYVNYLQENFYILNLSYFLKDAVDNLNETLIVSLHLSSLLYIGFCMINKNQDKYLNKVDKEFLEPAIYNNKTLFKELIKTLKIQLTEDYNYKEENREALDSLRASFIKKLPFKIRNELIEDIEIREKFGFFHPMKIWDKTVDLDDLLNNVERVLNQNKEKNLENLKIYLEEGELVIQNNETLEISSFSEDFYLLSQNKLKIKEVLEKNEEWIDCKKSRRKEIINKIQSISNPIKRFKEFEKYKRLSPEHYYKSLFNDSEKTKLIDFNYLIPESVLLVSNYFRYELIRNYEKNKEISITELLKDNNLSHSLHKVFALPQKLPTQVYVKIKKLNHKKQVGILKQYNNTVATPLNIFHLINLINETAKNKMFAKRIVRRIINKFYEHSLIKIKAYLSVYKYMYYEFKKKFELEENLLYMLSWGHADRIFRNFLALGTELTQIEKIFNLKVKVNSSEIFDMKTRLNVLHPLELDEISFLFKGLNYALEKNLDFTNISKFKKYSLIDNAKNIIPAYKLFKDYSLLENTCNSFMNKDYKNFFSYINEEEVDIFSNDFLTNTVNNTINDLKNNPDKFELYNILNIIFDNSCVYELNKKDLLELMLNINFKNIKEEYYIAILHFISIQNIYIKDKTLQKNIKTEIVKKFLACQFKEDLIPYFDILLYLLMSSTGNIEDRIRCFSDLLREIETELNKNILKTMLSNLVMHLPLNKANILVEYLLELRTKSH